ncbi:MAG TPA: hypothetical protein VFC07_14920, partial [Verrucomicrobiae bacterium]|nr:hypothetical protein [Verrucomicrobiae bacterium]
NNPAQTGGARAEGGSGSHPAGGSARPRGGRSTHTVYVLAQGADGKEIAKPIQIKTGINDGVFTEVTEGLKEGDEVITGLNFSTGASSASTSNPFGGGMRRF